MTIKQMLLTINRARHSPETRSNLIRYIDQQMMLKSKNSKPSLQEKNLKIELHLEEKVTIVTSVLSPPLILLTNSSKPNTIDAHL